MKDEIKYILSEIEILESEKDGFAMTQRLNSLYGKMNRLGYIWEKGKWEYIGMGTSEPSTRQVLSHS